MSIQTQIERLTDAKAALKTAIEQKGVAVPEGAPLEQYAPLVEQIVGGESTPWKLIRAITLDEAQINLNVSQDEEGNPFECSEIMVFMKMPKTDTKPSSYVRISDSNKKTVVFEGFCGGNTLGSKAYGIMSRVDQKVNLQWFTRNGQSNSFSGSFELLEFGKAASIFFQTQNAENLYPSGTNIEIYGR